MADYLFVPQTVLDRWSEQGKVQVEGHVLTLFEKHEQKAFALTEAVRFLRMEAGDDAIGLIHKVKTLDALKQMGAEHYLDSVILGESAYQVQQGFLADASVIRRAAEGSQDPAAMKGVSAATSPGVILSKLAPAEVGSVPPGRILTPAAPQKSAASGDGEPAAGAPLATPLLDTLR